MVQWSRRQLLEIWRNIMTIVIYIWMRRNAIGRKIKCLCLCDDNEIAGGIAAYFRSG